MRYTYYRRGRCKDCDNIIWTNHDDTRAGILCKCGKASIKRGKETNINPITDEEHVAELLATDFWWLKDETIDPTIDLLKGDTE